MKLALLFFLVAFPIYALTPTEKKIVANADQSVNDAVSLLEKVVNINSGTMNHEGVKQVGDAFRAEFDQIGFKTDWIPMTQVNRAGHLVATRTGSQGKRLLLIGHLDTVFEKDSPFQPFTRNGEKATGQGVNDMKGGDIILLYALKALQKEKALENTSLTVVFTGDEEFPGQPIEVSRKDLLDAAKHSDVALAFESAEGLDNVTVARRGVSKWVLNVKGVQSHSSDIFGDEVGSGAVFETARILNWFYEDLRGEKYLTFNPAVIVGGNETTYDVEQSRGTAAGKSNIVSKMVTVQGDLRFISNEQKEAAQEKMKKIVGTNLPKTSAEIVFTDDYPAMAPTEGNLRLLKVFDQVSRDLGDPAIQPFNPGARGAGDISFVASGLDCLDGLGVMGEGGHTPKEDIDLSSIKTQIERAAILIYRLTR